MKMLRVNFSLEILLHLTGLKRCSFFYHLQLKIDKNVAIRQEIVVAKMTAIMAIVVLR